MHHTQARSKSTLATLFAGRCPQRAVYMPHVFISHGHIDHVGGLHFLVATRGLNSLAPPSVYLPPPIVAATQQMLGSFMVLDQSDLACTLVPVAPETQRVMTSTQPPPPPAARSNATHIGSSSNNGSSSHNTARNDADVNSHPTANGQLTGSRPGPGSEPA